MFEVSGWCIVISVVMAAGVWLDGRRRQPIWRLPSAVWAIFVGLTWVGIVIYVIARTRAQRPDPIGAR